MRNRAAINLRLELHSFHALSLYVQIYVLSFTSLFSLSFSLLTRKEAMSAGAREGKLLREKHGGIKELVGERALYAPSAVGRTVLSSAGRRRFY